MELSLNYDKKDVIDNPINDYIREGIRDWAKTMDRCVNDTIITGERREVVLKIKTGCGFDDSQIVERFVCEPDGRCFTYNMANSLIKI